MADDDEMSFLAPKVVYVKPTNQLALSQQELATQVTRNLSWRDPQRVRNKVKFSYKEYAYKTTPSQDDDHLAIHFAMDGSALFRDSEEGKAQIELETARRKAQLKAEQEKQQMLANPEMFKLMNKDKDEDDESKSPEQQDDNLFVEKNQFNYFDKGCQTWTNPVKELSVTTVQPQTVQFSTSVAGWEIYDTYVTGILKEQREKQALKARSKKNKDKKSPVINHQDTDTKREEFDPMTTTEMSQALKVVERMVNHNLENEIYHDFKYWEDKSDQFRQGEGSLLPLWRFASESTRTKHVTALCWHPQFSDLFTVSYGSYDFMKQGSGLIYCYTLKNTACPLYAFRTSSGVLCVDWHPTKPNLLCCGCYDGSVLVFDVHKRSKTPVYCSTVKSGKHTDPVWQVVWQGGDDHSKELSFVSVSSDGRVASWSLLTSRELQMEILMELKPSTKRETNIDEDSVVGLAGGCSLDFNKRTDYHFLVGTEEGKIHKCSKAYSAEYLNTFNAHPGMTVYSIRCSHFHPNAFLSCSADWTVKLWNDNSKTDKPLMVFELGEAVGDVCWAPYSSTVFAAVTNAGKIHVYDLRVNKHEPICEQKVAKLTKLTRISFSPTDPILLIGDERGNVLSLKLSPNLRKDWKVGHFTQDQIDAETTALDTVISDVF
jgi:dynein intermediate chain 1